LRSGGAQVRQAASVISSEIMQCAVDYGYVSQDPLKVGERRHRFLPTPKAPRPALGISDPN
jgi:hypothetical protein